MIMNIYFFNQVQIHLINKAIKKDSGRENVFIQSENDVDFNIV